MQRRGTARIPLQARRLHQLPAHCRLPLAVIVPLWVRTPESLPNKVRPAPIKVQVHSTPSRNFQTRREPVSISAISSYSLRCLLVSPAKRSNTGMAKQTKGRRLLFAQVFAISEPFGWLDLVISSTLIVGTKPVPERLGNLYTLTQSAREDFIQSKVIWLSGEGAVYKYVQ